MNKIMLFEPGIGTDNLGDQVIVEGVKRAFSKIIKNSFVVEFSTHTPLYNRHIKHCGNIDYKFVCGSNLLVGNFGVPIRFKQWPVSILTVKSLSPCVLVGVGAQKYGQKMGLYTKKIYKKILSNEYMHSVRDEYTADFMKKNGFINVINTGCPTMWGLTKEKCKMIPKVKSKRVVFTLTDYRKNPTRDLSLIDILKREYDELWFWPQGSRDLQYLYSLNSHNGIKIIHPTLDEYDNFLSKYDTDYVGTRLHGGIRALQHKKRSIILGIDNRAIELNHDYNIPVVKMNEMDKLADIINMELVTDIHLPNKNIDLFLKQFGISYLECYKGKDR